jgi:hypothetical protein
VQGCPDGQMQRLWSHSGRQRRCPQGAGLPVERGLATQKAQLVACTPSQMLFPRPAALQGLGWAHVRPMTPVLWATVWQTVAALWGEATSLGAQPGGIAALPPWSQTVVRPPPGHGVVTGGGLSVEGPWGAVRHGCLRPVRVGMAGCRGNLVAAMATAPRRGQLAWPAGLTRRQGETRRHTLGRPRWDVDIRER